MTQNSAPAGGKSPLEAMIAPLRAEEFFEKYYEKDYFCTPEPVGQLGDLLTMDRIDEVLSDSELPPTSISMAKSGSGLPPEEYTFSNGVVDRGAVLDNFRDGATIVLPQLHFGDGRLYSFCQSLERDFGARLQTNIYLTPPGATGFGIHYDDHDVFVLQICGSKKWEIYGHRETLPMRGESFVKDRDDTGELKESFVLKPGQCLYVPRGLAHRAPNEGDEASLHITLGILSQSWAEFMLEAIAEASLRIPEMRGSLPRSLYYDPSKRDENAALFRSMMDKLGDTANFDATLAAFQSNFVLDQGPRVRGSLNALVAGIGDDDRFSLRDNTLYTFEQKGEQQQLAIGGSAIAVADDLAPQLRERLAAGNLAISDFTVADAEDLRDTVETLVSYGLLERA